MNERLIRNAWEVNERLIRNAWEVNERRIKECPLEISPPALEHCLFGRADEGAVKFTMCFDLPLIEVICALLQNLKKFTNFEIRLKRATFQVSTINY